MELQKKVETLKNPGSAQCAIRLSMTLFNQRE
jgi:hypothetical protein